MSNPPFQVENEDHSIKVIIRVLKEHFIENKSWVGVYVKNREKNEHYHQFQYVQKNEQVIIFKGLTDGIFDVRYFKQNYEKIHEGTITLGTELKPTCVVKKSDNEIKLQVKFRKEELAPGDWFSLFKSSEKSQKKPIVTVNIDTSQPEYFIDIGTLNLEPFYFKEEDGIKKKISERFEIRCFRGSSICYNSGFFHIGWGNISFNAYSFVPSGIVEINKLQNIIIMSEISLAGNNLQVTYSTITKDFEIRVMSKDNERRILGIYYDANSKYSGQIQIELKQRQTDEFEVAFVSRTTGNWLERAEYPHKN